MYGWRARLGLLVPASNTTNEPEFRGALPEGVSLHAARLPLEDVTADALTAMSDRIDRGAARLADIDVDIAAYGCTTGSLVEGHDYAQALEQRVAEAVDAPAVATALSVERALEAVGATTVTVVTPYNQTLDEREREFLEAGGVTVTSVTGRGIEDNVAIGRLRPEEAYRQARAAVDPDADAVFVSCTNYRTFEAIDSLETDLDRPVITSNQATLWDALRRTDVDHTAVDLGRLFDA